MVAQNGAASWTGKIGWAAAIGSTRTSSLSILWLSTVWLSLVDARTATSFVGRQTHFRQTNFNTRKANSGSEEDPRVDFFDFLYRSHLWWFWSSRSSQMTMWHYFSKNTHSDMFTNWPPRLTPSDPSKQKKCNYLPYLKQQFTQTCWKEYFSFVSNIFRQTSSIKSKLALSYAPLTLLVKVAWPLNSKIRNFEKREIFRGSF